MIVCTVGTFDLLHVGHLALLEYCSTLGDVVAVGVASDQVVNSYKPNVPVIPLDQRQKCCKHCAVLTLCVGITSLNTFRAAKS